MGIGQSRDDAIFSASASCYTAIVYLIREINLLRRLRNLYVSIGWKDRYSFYLAIDKMQLR